MNICLYTMHSTRTIGEMARLTVPNKLEYCKRHGYDYLQEEWTGSMFPGFERLQILIHLLKCGNYDWIFWLGTDCMITNLGIPLETLIDERYGIILSADFTQIQLDSFLIQRGHGALEAMQEVWGHRNNPIGLWYEQSTLDAISPRYPGLMKVLPQRAMNSYVHDFYAEWYGINPLIRNGVDINGHSGRWQYGDFIFHIPGRPYATKMQALRFMENYIQK